MQGIININKPKGISSFDVIRKLRKILHIKKIGHTGTLDPLATGVLIICVGQSTKLVSDIESLNKTYVVDFELGIRTDTYDIEGQVIANQSKINVSEIELKKILDTFLGETYQTPPMYSAIKINGKKLYELARKGIEVERKKRKIFVEYYEILNFDGKKARVRLKVSKGTYIRSIVDDIGLKLKTYAVMTELVREKVGENIDIQESYSLGEIEKMVHTENYNFLTLPQDFFKYPMLDIGEDNKKLTLFKNGNTVKILKNQKDGVHSIYSQNKFIGFGTIKDKIYLKGYKIF